MKPRTSNPFRPHLFTVAALLAVPFAHAAPIVWNAATTIAGDTDVLTAGALNYAYNFNNSTQTVNGVLFTGTNSTTTIGSNVTLNAGFLTYPNTFGPSPATGTFNGLSSAYKAMLVGADAGNTAAQTITLNNLTSGRVYATQVWVDDSRATGNGRTETVTSTGGNTVTLDYNNTNANGGVGQYTNGRFVADGATQLFTLKGSASTQINAFQVREVTNIGNWVGTGGATWDASITNNFASNLFSDALVTTTFAAAKVPLNSVVFADSYWNNNAQTAVTQTAVTVDAAGVSASAVFFDNSAVNYTIGNASGVIGITGGTAIMKSGSGTVTLDGANSYTGITSITGGTLQFNSSDNQTLSGAISGSGTLTKSNTGTLTSSANNSFNGVLNIDGGTLEFTNNDGGAHNVFQSTQININNGATLKVSGSVSGSNIEIYNGRNYTFDSNGGGSILVGQGNYNANTAGFSITTNGGARNNIGVIGGGTSGAFGMNLGTFTGTFNVALGTDSTSDLTVTPIIANSGSIVKTGNGRLTFAGANTYSGTTTISGGTLQIGGGGKLGNGTYNNTISIASGATLQYSSSAAQTLSGAITGAGGITKNTNTSDLNLSSASNTYNGTTTVSAGRIIVTAATHLSSGATSIVQSGVGQIFINSAATISNPFNISGNGHFENDSQLNYDGAIRMGGGTLSGPITLSGNARIAGVLTVTNTSMTNTISGKITGAFGIDLYGMQFENNSSFIYALSNTGNDYTGNTTITNSNYNTTNKTGVSTTLRLGASDVIPNILGGGNVAFAINGTNNNAVVALDLNGFSETINGLTVNAGTFATRITNNATGASVLTIGANDTTSSFSGTVTDAGVGKTLAITKIGIGTLTFSGTNNYIGGTLINDGTLTLGHATDTLANGGAVNINGGTLALGTNTDTVGAVTLTSGSITGSGAGTLTGTGSAFDVRSGTINAKLGGTVGLTKTTGGTVTISSDNSSGGYTGATTVSAGSLIVNGNISTSITTVSGTGTLGGDGTVGAVIVQAGGTLAPGNSIGTLNFNDTLSLAGIASFEIDPLLGLGLNADRANVTNGVTYGGTLNVLYGGLSSNFANGMIFNLFDASSFSGSFSTVNLPTLTGGLTWQNDLLSNGTLTVVPEPNVAALLGGFGVLTLLRRRRLS